MKNMLKDYNFMKTLLKIAVPISLQSLISSSLGMIDQMMIGQLGEQAVAGVGLGNRMPFIYIMVLIGITSTSSIYISQFFGKKDLSQISKVISATLMIGLPVSLLFLILALINPSGVVSLFTKDHAVAVNGGIYLSIVAFGFIPSLISLTFSSVLRSTHHARIPLVAGLFSVFTNTSLNYILIFGHFGMPALGIKGAAIATVCSRAMEMVLILVIIYKDRLPGAVKLSELMIFDSIFIKAFFITSLPLLINEFLWSLGESVYAGIYGRMGTSEAAGMIMTYPLQSFCISLFVGISGAAGIMLGNKIGENDEEGAYNISKRFVYIGLIGSLFVGLMIIFASPFYVNVFKVPDDVKVHATRLITVFGLVLFVKVSNMIIGGGILRSGGQTHLTLYLDMIGGWLIGIPLGLLTAFVFKLPVHYVYFFISLEEIFRMIVGIILLKRKVWIKNLVQPALQV